MQKTVRFIIITSYLLFAVSTAISQNSAAVKQGPKGIFVFTGKEIPSGKTIKKLKIERSEDNLTWTGIAELKTPSDINSFSKSVEKSQSFFPAQPMPASEKLSMLYERAVASANIDSLKGMRLLHPIRMALGVLYYDTTVKKQLTYRYRISAEKYSGEPGSVIITDTISFPLPAVFDTIVFSESSYNQSKVLIKWKSVGKNSAPLFMVHKFLYGAAVVAKGATSRFSMNDTTYYVYSENVASREAGKEMQFFVTPFDPLGNAGVSSQVAVITQDNFNKATFIRNHIAFKPALSGVQICWHFSDPMTVRTSEIFRSDNSKTGFRKIAEVSSSDTSYLDQQIWPERTYYYYIQTVAKAGKRTKQSGVLSASVPGMVMPEKLSPPRLIQVAVANKSVRLLVEVNDTTSTHLRIYRGVNGGLTALPELIAIENANVVSIIDSTLPETEMKDVFYAVRNEKTGARISGLSNELPVAMVGNTDDVAYFYAFPSNEGIVLYWDDVVNRKSTFTSYTLARQYGPANSRSPLKILAENLTASSFTDQVSESGNQYTYVLTLVDKSGTVGEKSFKVTYPSPE